MLESLPPHLLLGARLVGEHKEDRGRRRPDVARRHLDDRLHEPRVLDDEQEARRLVTGRGRTRRRPRKRAQRLVVEWRSVEVPVHPAEPHRLENIHRLPHARLRNSCSATAIRIGPP